MPEAVAKISALDSIRGIAALVVVFSHFINMFFPAAAFGIGSPIHTGFDIFIYQTPLSILFAGNFAVAMFFILSGFVLTLKYFSGKQKTLLPAAIKRYLRLMPIVFVSVMMGYALMSWGLMFFAGVGPLSGSDYAGSFFGFEPKLFDAFAQGLYGSFIILAQSKDSFNPVLWTIHYEFLASFLIFGIATLARGHTKRWILYGAAFLAFLNTYFCFFILGLILADLYVNKKQWYDAVRDMPRFYKWSLLIFALSIAAFPIFGEVEHFGRYWRSLIIFGDNIELSRTILQSIAGAIVIVLALSWTKLGSVLRHRYLLWLGKVSYALYAVHFILIFSLSSWLIVQIEQFMPYKFAALAAMAISLPVILALAYVLHKYVELPSISVANKIGEWSKR